MQQEYQTGQKLEVVVEAYTDLGIVVSFDDIEGLAYADDIFENYKIGEKVTAYIKNIRDDGKIDITFRRHQYKNYIDSTTDVVLNALKKANGFLPFNDKSDPEDIRQKFGISKSQFKQSIGKLFRERKIEILEDGIRLTK